MKFKTEDIVSSALGKLAGDMDGIYKVLSHMVGESLCTHQLGPAMKVVKDDMIEQHPWLNDVDFEGLSVENHENWLAELHEKFGAEHELTPSAKDVWGNHDPIEDLIEMRGGKTDGILVVNV